MRQNRKERLFTGLFIALVAMTVINTIVAYINGMMALGIINSVVLLGVVVYFLADYFS